MGPCKSKERDFKEYKRSKVLKKNFRSKVLKNKRKEAMRLLCITIREPSTPGPTFCMSVFYSLSFLHLQSPPVRSGKTGA
jgi:hypothetical protein